MAGLAQARGDIVVTLDGDLQNPPEEVPKLVAAVDDGHDVVGGVRRRRMDTWFRRTASRTMNRIMGRITGVYVTDYGCMLRAYRRDIVDAILDERRAQRVRARARQQFRGARSPRSSSSMRSGARASRSTA